MTWVRGLVRNARVIPFAAAAIIVVIVVFSARNMPWRGEWLWTFDWIAGATVLLGPLVAAGCAYETARWRFFVGQQCRGRLSQLVAGATIGAVPTLLCGVGALLLASVAAAAWTAGSAQEPLAFSSLTPLFLAVVNLIVVGLLGVAIGCRVTAALAAAIAGVAAYALVLLRSRLDLPKLLAPGGTTGTLAGLQVNAAPLLPAFLLAVGACSGLMWLTVRRFRPGNGQLRFVAVGPVVLLGVGVLLANVVGTEDYRFASSPSFLCLGRGQSTCVSRDNSTVIKSWAGALDHGVAQLQALGLTPRERYQQQLPGRRVPPAGG